MLACDAGDLRQHPPPGRAQRLEAGQLGLDGHAGIRCRLDQRTAVRQNSRGRRLLGRHPGGGCRVGIGPQRTGIGVQAQHELGGALRHPRSERVAEEAW